MFAFDFDVLEPGAAEVTPVPSMAPKFRPPVEPPELLLLGSCNSWGKDLQTEERRGRFCFARAAEPQEAARLQLELAGAKLSFQVVCAKRRWHWRLYPGNSGATLQRGSWCDARLSLDPEDPAAHGRNFRIIGEGAVVITVLLDPNGGRVRYEAPPSLAGVGGSSAGAASSAAEQTRAGGEDAPVDSAWKREVVSSRSVRLAPEPHRVPVRVAAMLMLLPSALRECPGVFRTYLWYHLLAPQGPRLAHVFVFVDGPRDGASEALERWLAEVAPAELRAAVTLLDGSGPAALAATEGSNRPAGQHTTELRVSAAMGELCAKQVLNMERCLALARERQLDWLICNLDVDEALVCSGGAMAGSAFAAAPPELLELQLLNHEAVAEEAADPDYFRSCTLFKRSPYLLGSEAAQRMRFWSERAAAVGGRLAVTELADARWRRGSGPLELYFTAYSHGKAAVRVAAQVLPLGPHRWNVKATARVRTRDAFILHYNNCEGAEGLVRKYAPRAGERWNQLRMHTLCQHLQATALTELFEQGLAATAEDAQEVQAQLAEGVCLRIRNVQRACENLPRDWG